MGKDVAEQFPAAREIFSKADQILGFPLSRLCWEGPQEALTRTEQAQVALYVTSLACLEALKSELKPEGVGPGGQVLRPVPQRGLTPAAAGGLSLGEYTALAAAGVLSFEDGLKLVHLRGQAMEEASQALPGTMASVLGLELDILEAICAESGAQVANINSPGQVVISGTIDAVQAASDKAKEKGAKRVMALEVGGAFHSRLMEPAGARLEAALEAVSLHPFQFPVVSNVTGSLYQDPSEARILLVKQLTHPVQWVNCMRALLAGGVRTFLEVGTGSVLKGLLRTIDSQATAVSVGTASQIHEAAKALA